MGNSSTPVTELLKLMENDPKAFQEKCISVKDSLFLYARYSLKWDDTSAEEIVHQVVGQVLSKIKNGELTEILSIEAYMMQSVKQISMRWRGKEKKFESFQEFLAEPSAATPETEHEDQERMRYLMSCIQNLSKPYRKFFFTILRILDESDTEMANKLRMDYKSFRTRKSRLIHILHECVQQYLSPQI